MKQSSDTDARQMKRAKAVERMLKFHLGRVIREIQRQNPATDGPTDSLMEMAKRIRTQKPQDSHKLYSVHEPNVNYVANGKGCEEYGSGNKRSLAIRRKGSWIVGTVSLRGNPDHVHTLGTQFKHVRDLLGGGWVREVFADRDYRGHNKDGKEAICLDRERRGPLLKSWRRFMKRPPAMEPPSGQLKREDRLEQNCLKRTQGNVASDLVSAAEMNFGKLLKWVGQFRFFLSAPLRTVFPVAAFSLPHGGYFFNIDYFGSSHGSPFILDER
jgi:IS5 family transposase